MGTLGGVEGESEPFDMGESLKYISEYVGGQLGIISAFFIPFMVMAIRRLVKYKERKMLFNLLPAILVWMMFFLISITKRVEVNWPAFAYVTLPIAMAYVLTLVGQGWKKYATYATAISGILLILIMKPAPLDAIGFRKVLRPDKDPLARLAGYREMGARIDFLVDSLQLQKHFIFSDSYHLASEMAFYVEGNPQTYTINLGRRKNQFDHWPGIDQFENQQYDGVFVQWNTADRPKVIAGFDKRILKETHYATYRGDTVRVFSIEIYQNLHHIDEVKTDSY